MKFIIIIIVLIIIIIYTIIDSYLYLNYNTTINNIIYNTNANGNVNINGNSNGNVNGNSNGNVNVNGNVNGNVKGNANVNGNVNGNANVNVNGNANVNVNGNANVNVNGNGNKKEELLIKYSSIKNKLNSPDDYIGFYAYIEDIKNSIYVSIVDNIIYDENHIIEIIINDIQKTKMAYNFKKLKNIYVINNLKENFNKIIIFYEGVLYNQKKFRFVENDFSGNTIVYKLNLHHKLINHYLQ
jgi:hypothetical protein